MNVFPTEKIACAKTLRWEGAQYISVRDWRNTNMTGAERLKGKWEEGRLEKQAWARPGRDLQAIAKILGFILTTTRGDHRCLNLRSACTCVYVCRCVHMCICIGVCVCVWNLQMRMNWRGARVHVERSVKGIAVVKAEYWARSVVVGDEVEIYVRSLTYHLRWRVIERTAAFVSD